MNEGKVSIIIPVYNVEKYLQRCIDSLRAQTYENTEMIFVDDGSTDSSYQILQQAAETDSRIRVFSQENAGPSAARNLGMDNCTGEYIMFCDSDDTVEPAWTEKMVEAIREYPDAWVVCGYNDIHENFGYKCSHLMGKRGALGKSIYYEMFRCGLTGSACNKIFSRDLIRRHRLHFDQDKNVGEDVLFCLDYLEISREVYLIDEGLYNYYKYQDKNTLTNTYHVSDVWSIRDMYNARLPFIDNANRVAFQLHYWRLFSVELEKAMQHRKEVTVFKQARRNNEIVATKEYQELLSMFGRTEMNAVAFACLQMGRYDAYWLIQKLYQLKENLRKRIR